MGKLAQWAVSTCVLLCSISIAPSLQAAPSAEVIKGLNWLEAQIQPNGSLLNELQSIASPLQNHSEAAQTLKILATVPSPLVDRIAAETDNNTEYLARQIIAYFAAGRDTSVLISEIVSRQNEDGGFGGAVEFDSNPLDTAFALMALKTVSNASPAVISNAVNYLLQTQATSGGYSASDNASDVYISALASVALQVSANTIPVITSINKTNTWLLSMQKQNGGWGTVTETSLAYLALLGTTSDPALQNLVSTSILAQQSADGSWNGDPYVTALALRALVARPRPVPTTGNILGHVIDGSTGLTLSGASAVIQQVAGSQATSDNTGKFTFTDIAAGNYTISVSSPGYASLAANFALQAGTTIDLGVFSLMPAPTTGIIQGTVQDSATGLPLAGVVITVTGSTTANTTTQADGTYKLTGLAPGSITVSASKSGYDSAGGTGTIVAGSILLFSPSLKLAGTTPPTPAGVTGQVLDATTQAPLVGVTITVGVGGPTTTSGADGRFTLMNIPEGSYPISFSLIGYITKSLTAFLSGGTVSDLQIIKLSKSLNTVVVIGKVTDVDSAQAIANASVNVLGTTVSAVTNNAGNYRLEGVPQGNATIRYSAIGYTSETLILTFATPGEYQVDRALKAGQGSILSLSVATDKPNYNAYAPTAINIQVQNSGGLSATGAVSVTIVDGQGKIIDNLQATRVDANGVVQNTFEFVPGNTAINLIWNTVANSPGAYSVIARIYQADAGNFAGSAIQLAEKQAGFAIDPTQSIESAKLTPLPGYTNLGATEQVGFKLDIVNRSNIPVTTGLSFKLQTPGAAALIYGATLTVQLDPTEGSKSLLLNGLQYKFMESGVYPSTLAYVDGAAPAVLEGKTISVAPGTRIDPTLNIVPSIITPDGDKRIQIDIRLQGVEQK